MKISNEKIELLADELMIDVDEYRHNSSDTHSDNDLIDHSELLDDIKSELEDSFPNTEYDIEKMIDDLDKGTISLSKSEIEEVYKIEEKS